MVSTNNRVRPRRGASIVAFLALSVAAMVVGLGAGPAPAPSTSTSRSVPPLGVMPFTMEQRPPAEQARVAHDLGYAGITCWYSPDDAGLRRIEAFQAAPHVADGRVPLIAVLWAQRYDQPFDRGGFDAALKRLAITKTRVWLMLEGPEGNDDALVDRVRDLVDQARPYGVTIVLYPHYKHAIPTAEAALRVLKRADRSELKLSLHLCHELKAGNDGRLADVIAATRAHLELVSVSGADTRAREQRQTDDWRSEIRPLDAGDFDVAGRYLRPLIDAGYTAPILLHSFGLTEPTEAHLKRSRAWWGRLAGGG